jgi:hypothetical protein
MAGRSSMPAIEIVATSIQYCVTVGLTTWFWADAAPQASKAGSAK